jgi:hypothetical protein
MAESIPPEESMGCHRLPVAIDFLKYHLLTILTGLNWFIIANPYSKHSNRFLEILFSALTAGRVLYNILGNYLYPSINPKGKQAFIFLCFDVYPFLYRHYMSINDCVYMIRTIASLGGGHRESYIKKRIITADHLPRFTSSSLCIS